MENQGQHQLVVPQPQTQSQTPPENVHGDGNVGQFVHEGASGGEDGTSGKDPGTDESQSKATDKPPDEPVSRDRLETITEEGDGDNEKMTGT